MSFEEGQLSPMIPHEQVYSSEEVEEFLINRTWSKIKKDLLDRIEGHRDDLEKAQSFDDIIKAQSKIEEVRFLMQFPEFLLEEIKEREAAAKPGKSNTEGE